MSTYKPVTQNLRRGLAAAATTLLTAGGARADSDPSTYVDAGVLYYKESDRIQAIEPAINAALVLEDDSRLTFGATIDSLTGATPLGAVPSTAPQTFVRPYKQVTVGGPQTVTTASGGRVLVVVPGAPGATTQVLGTSQTVTANQYPLDNGFKDLRYAGHVNWDKSLSDTVKLTTGGAFSRERDYRSVSFNAALAWDFNAHNTTLSVGTNFEKDSSFPVGGTPTALTVMSADWKNGSRSKNEIDALLGLTQVMGRRWLTSLSYSYERGTGYQTDPYRIISVVDPISGDPTTQLYESRPETRLKQSLYWDNKIHFPGAVLDLAARAYKDDWGVRSTTVDARYRFKVAESVYLEPHLRYYKQTAADFYRYFLVQGEPLPAFASADTRLGDFKANTLGLKVGVSLGRNSEVNFRLERYMQQGDGHPSSAIGQLRQQNLFPDLKGATLLINYSYAY